MRKNKRTRKNRMVIKKMSPTYKKVMNFSIIVLAIVFFSVIFAVINLGSQKILNGITINGLKVSGLTIEQAKEFVNQTLKGKIHDGIKLRYDDQEYTFELNELNIEYNFDQQLQDAYRIGRSGNIVKDNFTILYMMLAKKEYNFNITYNDELLNRQIDYLEIQLPDRAVDNKYYVEDTNLIIVRGLDGVVINKNIIEQTILAQITDLSKKEVIDIPVIEKTVEDLNINEIHNEIYKKAENAYYTTEPFEIHPHVVGLDFAISNAEIEEKISKNDTDYAIPLKYTEPEVTIDNLDINVFPDLLSQFDTTYNVSDKNKTNNLEIAVEKINGVILKPGETFSYNKVLGARTVENGYKEAPIYSNGKVVNGLGGGICQVSTTLYNSVVLADLEVLERQNHMFIPSYIRPGCDATVVYGSIDFKFKNTRDYPIKIVASANSGVARVSIYGIYNQREYSIHLETEVLEILPYDNVYINDNTLESGEEKIIQKGQNGTKVETYKVVKFGSAEISRTLLSVDTYRPMQETILKGI